MADPEKYTVGWIYAVETEFVAARAFFDEEHDIPDYVSPNDNNNYALGKIGKHHVVMAVLPSGEYGIATAASVASNMRTSFPNVRFGLMVGIGGGVPTRHDVRLGDVVVGAPRNGGSGVFQYDFGDAIQNQTFRATGFMDQPPTILRTAVNGLKTQYVMKGHNIQAAVTEALQKYPRLRNKYRQPDSTSDRLYQSEHVHQDTDNADCATACGTNQSYVVVRRERNEEEDNPTIHYGLIASANRLMQDAIVRDQLAEEKDILCFEMEAAGLANHFLCLVIRGICDYADSHKNWDWQGYAAMVAVAYAKDLLSRIVPAQIEAQKKITDVVGSNIVTGLKDVTHAVDQAAERQDQHHQQQAIQYQSERQRQCHLAFKTCSYEEYKNINPERTPGTCQWVLNHHQYQKWSKNLKSDLLWISADPGCGKSVLARTLVDQELRGTNIHTVCYFFFKDNDDQNSLARALCALLHQLFASQPYLISHALPAWEKHGTSAQSEIEELWRVLLAAASSSSHQITCILDALDECREDHRKRLISMLVHFYERIPRKNLNDGCLKFLITSRPYDDIQYNFDQIPSALPSIHLRGDKMNDDIHEEINLVVRARVVELATRLPLGQKVKDDLEKRLLQMEHRTYLWLHLAIEGIRATYANSPRPERESIESLPSSVEDAYEKILVKISSDQRENAQTILRIIVGARRPLTIEEMAIAWGMATLPSARTAEEAKINPTYLEKTVRRLCGLFVFFNNSRIYLIHQTAKEFLVGRSTYEDSSWKHCLDPGGTEKVVAQICVNYLLLDDWEEFAEADEDTTETFLEYSAINWPDHFRNIPSSPDLELETSASQLYDDNSSPFALWFRLFWRATMPYTDQPNMRPLHLAAFSGHDRMIRQWLDERELDLDQQDSTRARALVWASIQGYLLVVRLLIQRGADVNAQGGEYGNALYAASCGGHREIVELLLKTGKTNVNTRDIKYDRTPLLWATENGHEAAVQILLNTGQADIEARDRNGRTSLSWAAGNGNKTVFRMLLDTKKVKIDSRDNNSQTPLLWAAEKGHETVVQMLLSNPGVSLDVKTHTGLAAIQLAHFNHHQAVEQLLVEHGASDPWDFTACRHYFRWRVG